MNADGLRPDGESEIARRIQALIDDAPSHGSAIDSDADGFVDCLKLVRKLWSEEGTQEANDGHAAGLSEHDGTRRPDGVLPRRLGRFEVRRILGHGGFGIVLLAFDETLARDIALKIPRPELLLVEEMRARFVREAKAAAVLDHPRIVPVFETGEVGAVCYIAAGYVKGPSLAQWLKESPQCLSHSVAARLVVELADAVQHAHSRGILHRDLKPSNVLLEPCERTFEEFQFAPKLTDFGLAKQIEGEEQHTLSGVQIGTPRYMAPEQAANRYKEIGVATDIYGLGAILHELLAGEPPFVGESNAEVLKRIQEEELSPARLRSRRVPRDLETICLKCLEKEPARRYQSARDLADDLGRFVDGEPVLARPIRLPARLVRWCRRRPVVAGLASALIVAVTAGTTTALWQWYRAEQHLSASVAATAQAEEQGRRAEQTLLDLAWLVEESSLWGQESSQFNDAVHEKLKRYYENAVRPGDPRWTPILAAIHSFDAQHAQAAGELVSADSKYRLALDAWREANRHHPEKKEYRRALALCLRNFSLLVRGRSQAAGATDSSAVLRDFYSNLGNDERYGIGFLRDYAELMLDHGELLATQNRKSDARDSLELGTIAAELALEKAPDDAARRFLVAKLWRCLADVQAGQREHAEAVHSIERAIEILGTLATTEPEQTSYFIELSAAYYRRAVMETGPGAHEREVDWLEKSIALAERVMQSSSDDSANRLRLAISLRSLARSLSELNRADEAWAASERHGEQLGRMEQYKDLIPPDEFRSLARAYHRRGIQANAAGDDEAAAAVFEKGASAFEKAVGFKFGVIDILLWAECHYFLARRGEAVGDKGAAIGHYERAVDLLKDLAERRDANVAVKDRYRKSIAGLAALREPVAPSEEPAGQ